jgi:hypothetical protein
MSTRIFTGSHIPPAHMDVHDLADRKAAHGAHFQRGEMAAFERCRGFGDTRHLNLLARQQVELRSVDLADVGGKIDGALIHLLT